MQISKILHIGSLYALLTLVSSLQLFGQKNKKENAISLYGTVRSASGEALPGVTVFVSSVRAGANTNSEGYYELKGVPAGDFLVEVSAVGFVKISEKLSFQIGGKLVRNFTLQEENKELGEVKVFGKSENQEVKEKAFTVNAIETKQFANTTSDLNQVLNRSTGVRIREQGGLGSDFNFSINGLSGKAVRFFIDGVPLETMGSAMSLNNVPVNLAERIEVYKGVMPIDLGADALGGAVNIITNQKSRNFLDASYSYGSFNTHRTAITGQVAEKKSGVTFKLSAFHNYSDNNYLMRGIEIWNQAQYAYVPTDLKRFHDTYQSAMVQLEAGVSNKKWSDQFFVGGSYSANRRDIQTGARQDAVYGAAFSHGHAYSVNARYRKDDIFVKGLNVNGFVSYSVDNFEVVDTSYVRYAWDGSFVTTNVSELNQSGRSMNHISRPKLFLRANAAYQINPVHAFSINQTTDNTDNQIYDAYSGSDVDHDYLKKSITGLSYQQTLLNSRLSNTVFVKYYVAGLKIEQESTWGGDNTVGTGKTRNTGYGIASRFKLTDQTGLKASFEKAYRLQTADEVLGDGVNLIPNYELRPENSRNINLGVYASHRFNDKHRLFFEAGWFYRDVKDFINAVILLTDKMQYKNTSAVRVDGLEGEVKYGFRNLIDLTVNASYQHAINNTREFEGKTDVTYKNRIPNQPWIFGNADFSIGKNDLIGKNTRLQFNWYTQYVHWFYRTWEALGNPDGKAVIPSQLVHNAVATYSLRNGMYNISVECKNLTNELAYDNFRLQKPGRAFYVKLRYFLR